MKLFVTFLFAAMVAIAMEKCVGRYLLVEIENGKYFVLSKIGYNAI